MAANLEGLGLEVLLAVTRFVCQHLQARKMCLLVLDSVTPGSTFITCLCSREHFHRLPKCAPLGSIHIAYLCLCI